MADDTPLTDETSQESGGRSRKKLIVLAVVVLVAGVGGFFAMRLLSTPATAAPAPEPTPEPGAIVEVADMTTTLPGTPPHLARVNFSVQLSAEAVAEEIQPDLPLLKDAAVTELAESDAETLMTTEGVDDLRARLLDRATEIYPDDQVLKVLVTELVVQ